METGRFEGLYLKKTTYYRKERKRELREPLVWLISFAETGTEDKVLCLHHDVRSGLVS